MRLIDADALKEEIAVGKEHVAKHQDPTISLLTYVIDGFSALVDKKPTIDAIPVEWLRQKAEENSHYAEPYFAFEYVLHEWQQTKSIEELQAESEMRDW